MILDTVFIGIKEVAEFCPKLLLLEISQSQRFTFNVRIYFKN